MNYDLESLGMMRMKDADDRERWKDLVDVAKGLSFMAWKPKKKRRITKYFHSGWNYHKIKLVVCYYTVGFLSVRQMKNNCIITYCTLLRTTYYIIIVIFVSDLEICQAKVNMYYYLHNIHKIFQTLICKIITMIIYALYYFHFIE